MRTARAAALFGAAVLALTTAPSASAVSAGTDLYVGDCRPDSFATIQEAVDAVDSAGSTVWVCPGSYAGFSVTGHEDLTVRNLPVKNRAAPSVASGSLLGVTVDDSAGTTIRGLRFSGNLLAVGVGEGATGTTLRGLLFSGVQFGVFSESADDLVVERSLFAGTGTSFGVVVGGGEGVEVSDNRVTGSLFGIVVSADSALVEDNGVVGGQFAYALATTGSTISSNRAKFGDIGFAFTDLGLGSGSARRAPDAGGNRVLRNVSRANDVGMYVEESGSRFGRNLVRGNADIDVADDSTGLGTAGTANLWKRTACDVSDPAGICGEAPSAAPRAPDLSGMQRRIDAMRAKVGR